jgi:hypothetical protein
MRLRAAPLLVAALVAACNNTTTSSLTPTPIGDHGAPPAGVPLFYAGDATHTGWYTGFDWAGKPRGTVKLAQPPDSLQTLLQAPDGSAFLLLPFKGEAGQFLDRLGHPVGGEVPRLAAWADDSKQLCTLDNASGPWRIGVMTPGDALPAGVRVTFLTPAVPLGVIAFQVAACRPRNNVAVLTYAFPEYQTYVWEVRLSDGFAISNEAFDRNSLAGIVASPDGKLFAENSNASTGYLQSGSEDHTAIRRFANGSVVVRLDPKIGILAFSADDSVALVNTSPWASGVATHLALVKVDTGAVLWHYDGDEEYAGALIQPEGSSIAVMLQTTTDQSSHPSVDLLIVRADGSTTAIPGKYVRP